MTYCPDHVTTVREIVEIKTLIESKVLPALGQINLMLDGKPHMSGTGVRSQVQADQMRITAIEQSHGKALTELGRKTDEVLVVLRGNPSENGGGGLVGRVTRLERVKDRVVATAIGIGFGAGFGALGIEKLIRLVL